MESKQQHFVGVDLLKIMAMCGIIVFHICGNGGIINSSARQSTWMIRFIYCVCAAGVDLFAITTGYLYAHKNPKHATIVNLGVDSIAVPTIITCLFACLSGSGNGIKWIILNIFPFLQDKYWYITYYFVLILFVPILNSYINRCTQKNFTFTMVMLLGLCSVLPTIANKDLFSTLHGFSVIWLIVCYLIGAYIRSYERRIFEIHTKMLFAGLVVNWILQMSVAAIEVRVLHKPFGKLGILRYTHPFVVITAILVFCIFLRLKNRELQRGFSVIKVLSGSTFFVYLFHLHPLIMDTFIRDKFAYVSEKILIHQLGIIVLTTIVVYVIGMIASIMYCRIKRALHVSDAVAYIAKKIEELSN